MDMISKLAKLSENGNRPVYVKIAKTFPSSPDQLEQGMISPVTSRNTRYILGQLNRNSRFERLGEVDLNTGILLDAKNYGPENTRDAKIIVNAILNN